MKVKKDILSKISSSLTSPTNSRRLKTANRSNIYLYQNTVTKNSELNIGEREESVVVPRDTAVATIDLEPLLNWGHPCKHVLFDAETGEEYASVDANLPLSEFYTDKKAFETIQQNTHFEEEESFQMPSEANSSGLLNIETNSPTGERYAILFSGMSNRRHTNDLEFLYRTLVDIYKFKEENICVLNENGSIHHADWISGEKWPGDNTNYRMKVKGAGTKEALRDAIRNLRGKLKKDDLLLIHTNNHGDRVNGNSVLCCWPNWKSFTTDMWGEELAALPQYRTLIVMMEQCFSGGFMDVTLRNSTAKRTHFAAACRANRSSMGGANFDPYALQWITAMTGKGPDGSGLLSRVDNNCDNRVSAIEAHEYAVRHKVEYDTPVSGGSPFRPIGNILYLDEPIVVVGNRNSGEFHQFGCSWVQKMSEDNMVLIDSPQEAVKRGYNGCWYCMRRYDTD